MKPDFLDSAFLVHSNNLQQKGRLLASMGSDASEDSKSTFATVFGAYQKYSAEFDYDSILNDSYVTAVEQLNEYYSVAKKVERHRLFNWRSDFVSSIIPEFLYRSLQTVFHARNVPAIFSTRESVVELQLCGTQDLGWNIRRKNQDMCIGLRSDSVLVNGAAVQFLIPLVAMEVKTNIDVNKINGLNFSAERLKRTFPNAKYMLATETIDFSLADNYASGSIDEIYTLRKQMRSLARRKMDPLQPDVFRSLTSDLFTVVNRATVSQGHVYERLVSGRLIHRQL